MSNFQILSNSEKRLKYDAIHPRRRTSSESPSKPEFRSRYGSDFRSHYEPGFSSHFRSEHRHDFGCRSGFTAPEGQAEDITVPLNVTLEELLAGATKEVVVRRTVVCEYCRKGNVLMLLD